MDEFNRQYDVINMMTTMHSVLHEKYKRRVLIINTLLLITSFILCIISFMDIELIQQYVDISRIQLQTFRGVCSVIVFAISVIMLKVKWKEKMEAHLNAKAELFRLISKCRSIWKIEDEKDQKLKIEGFNNEYIITNQNLIPIPDNKFLQLKAYHFKKVALSKFIDKNKKVPYLVLKWRFFYQSIKK